MTNFKKVYYILSNKQKKLLLWLSLFSFILVFLELVGLSLIFPIISMITDPSIIKNFIAKYDFLDFLIKHDDRKLLYTILSCVIIFYLLKNLFSVFVSYAKSKINYLLIASISDTMFYGYISQPLGFSNSKNSAYITRNIIDYSGGFVNHVLVALFTVLFESFFIFSTFFFFIKINFEIGMLISLLTLLLIIFFYFSNKSKLITYGRSLNNRYAERLKVTRESIEGIQEINLYNKKNFFINLFKEHNYRIVGITAILEVKQALPKYLLEFLVIFFISCSIFFLLESGHLINEIIPTIGFISAGLIKIIPSISKIFSSFQRYQSSDHVINQLYEEISKFRKVEINKNIEFSFRNKIDFKNISFKYENSNIYLKNINFTIKKNTIFGIKGKSGSGKSTCLNLITGFLNPTKGAVLVDGKSIRKNVNNWQKIIAYIPQRVFLIDGTLKENICFGIKENSIDYVKLEKALNYSQIKDFIDPNQGGLNKLLGERGKKISAGQIQRIGLARALYKSPQILILDESTSALDKKTENKILQDVSKLKNIMTIIIVSHSDEVLSFCDSTYNLDLKK